MAAMAFAVYLHAFTCKIKYYGDIYIYIYPSTAKHAVKAKQNMITSYKTRDRFVP